LDFSFEENKISEQTLPYRQTEKYKNAITEQIAFAEKYRNQMLDYTIGGNPYTNEDIGENMFGDCHLDSSCSYIDENINENIDESSVISDRNIIITGWSDPTYVTEELKINIIDRESPGFEVIQALEIEIAKNTLDEMGYLPNFEVSNEIISLTIQNEHRDIERGDTGFEYLKDKEIDAAEKKLMEILGQKIIHNLDY